MTLARSNDLFNFTTNDLLNQNESHAMDSSTNQINGMNIVKDAQSNGMMTGETNQLSDLFTNMKGNEIPGWLKGNSKRSTIVGLIVSTQVLKGKSQSLLLQRVQRNI